MDSGQQDPHTEEQFRQFQTTHLERQTKAIEEVARHTYTVRTLFMIWFWLSLVGGFLLLATAR